MIEKVRIDSAIYTVVETDEVIVVEGIQCGGSIDYQKGIITISTLLCERQKYITLWHEIMHGIFNERGVDARNEESAVDSIAKGVIQVLMDNPELSIVV